MSYVCPDIYIYIYIYIYICSIVSRPLVEAQHLYCASLSGDLHAYQWPLQPEDWMPRLDAPQDGRMKRSWQRQVPVSITPDDLYLYLYIYRYIYIYRYRYIDISIYKCVLTPRLLRCAA